jgi:type IV secretion system protein VirB8
VRFVRASGEPGTEREQHYVATVQYAYATPSKDDRLRGANPLGFKVLEYRREPEVLESQATQGAGR